MERRCYVKAAAPNMTQEYRPQPPGVAGWLIVAAFLAMSAFGFAMPWLDAPEKLPMGPWPPSLFAGGFWLVMALCAAVSLVWLGRLRVVLTDEAIRYHGLFRDVAMGFARVQQARWRIWP